MLKNNGAKTVSGRKKSIFLLAGLVVLLIIITVVIATKSQKPNLTIGSQTIEIERVSTPEALANGLSNRPNLGQDNGMLFEFAIPGKTCFWMKDMNFPLDMVWLDEQKHIMHIEQNVPPESYPATFCPPGNASYVLETNAGKTAEWGWAAGNQASF